MGKASEQKSPFAKTLGVMRSASNTIKSSTQQAAKIISRDNKLEKRIMDELNRIFNGRFGEIGSIVWFTHFKKSTEEIMQMRKMYRQWELSTYRYLDDINWAKKLVYEKFIKLKYLGTYVNLFLFYFYLKKFCGRVNLVSRVNCCWIHSIAGVKKKILSAVLQRQGIGRFWNLDINMYDIVS